MTKFTFLEFHLHSDSVQMGPKSIGVPGADVEEDADESPDADEDEEASGESGGKGKAFGALVFFFLLVAVAVAAKKLGDGGDVPEELESLDDLS